MIWLIAFLGKHAAAIALIGAAAGTISAIESAVINADVLIERVEKRVDDK